MMNPLQMWWLNLGSEKLLAVYCKKGQANEKPFQNAASYMRAASKPDQRGLLEWAEQQTEAKA